jgi:polyhydroxyalkanoate synthase subunit PhaC
MAKAALEGLAAYAAASGDAVQQIGNISAQAGGASLRARGGSGPPAVLIPSLINPPSVLDLDRETSLARSLVRGGRSVFIVDWGPAEPRRDMTISDHLTELLIPLIGTLKEPPALVGYCLGGTMAMAAANLVPVPKLVTIAAPWHFSAYPDKARYSLTSLWRRSRRLAERLGMLPMEVLQAGFWALDPERVVTKFAHFASLAPDSAEARRFVALEDWANQGEPLPLPAARDLFDNMFIADRPGRGEWRVGGRLMSDRPPVPHLAFAARRDCIVPAASAPGGDAIILDKGHVGMIVGSNARKLLHRPIAEWLAD